MKTLFAFFTSALVPIHALAQCLDHMITDSSDPVVQAFCQIADETNQAGAIPLMKKPRCPKNGPSSKCNPTSIVVPDEVVGAMLWMSPDGSYGSSVIERITPDVTSLPDPNDPNRVASTISNFNLVGDSDFVTMGSDKMLGQTANWRITEPESAQQNQELQNLLKRAAPWTQTTIENGGTVLFVIQDN